MIMYTLLAGSPPFWHRKQMLMLRMIMNGDYQFGSPEWDDRSDTVKDLVGAQGKENLGGSRCLGHPGSIQCPPADLPVPGGGPPAAVHGQRGAGTPLLPAVRRGRGSALQPLQEIQGEGAAGAPGNRGIQQLRARAREVSGGLDFLAKMGETGHLTRLVDRGFGRTQQPGWRCFSEHCFTFWYFLRAFSQREG